MSSKTPTSKSTKHPEEAVASVVPQGLLRRFQVSEIKPSRNNPRLLFDLNPLRELKENIRQHGVLVPITVYEIKGQRKYAILDGERRYRCCAELEEEGHKIMIPANVVEPPDKIAGILYMFSIHNFREQWELMPTALSLKAVMKALGEQDSMRLSKLTGLSEPQIERCKILLTFPERFQNLSLDLDPKTRIPSNFWIEASPVLDLCEKVLPDIAKKIGRDGLTDHLVQKYQAKRIKSVIHFRRIIEAFEVYAEDEYQRAQVTTRLREYVTDAQLETRIAFDEFVVDNRRIQSAIKASQDFISQLQHAKLDHTIEREQLIEALTSVKDYIEMLLKKLEGSDQPELADHSADEDDENISS
ncbi:MAG TPA: ParB N-terminal domain-containing protein [Nitrososphaera sp.]|nr:ParB N-terminal domain-containing protein [Nitrososphaera sp.]